MAFQEQTTLPHAPAGNVSAPFSSFHLIYYLIFLASAVVFLDHAVDKPVALYFKYDADPRLVALFRSVEYFGKPDAYIAVCLIIYLTNRSLFVANARNRRGALFCRIADWSLYLLTALAIGGVAVTVAKYAVGRLRPRGLFESELYGFFPLTFDTDYSSLPSGHAQVIWLVATALSIMLPRWAPVFIACAIPVSVSRVVVTSHFVSDIIVGAVLGIAVALAVRRKLFASLRPFGAETAAAGLPRGRVFDRPVPSWRTA